MRSLLSRPVPVPRVGDVAKRSRPAAPSRPLRRQRATTQLPRARAGEENGRKEVDRTIHNPELDHDIHPDTPDSSDAEEQGLVDYFNDMPIDDRVGERTVMSLDDIAELQKEGIDMGLDKLKAYGPEAVFAAGFRLEELSLLQAVLDMDEKTRGGRIRLILVTDEQLGKPVNQALQAAPLPLNAIYGAATRSSWGSERVVLFSGLTIKDQGTLMELIDELGLGRVSPGQIDEDNCTMRLGNVLAEAVQEYRKALARHKAGEAPIWEREADELEAEAEAEAAKTSAETGTNSDWVSQLPKGYDLKSDDPTNLGNALNTDGTVNSEFVGSLMGDMKEQMLQLLKDQNVNLEELDDDLELNIGGEAVDIQVPKDSSMPDNGIVDSASDVISANEKMQDRDLNAQVPMSDQQGVTSNGPSPNGSEEGKQAALAKVEAAFELALRGGTTSAELEALIDDVYEAELGPSTKHPKELERSSTAPTSSAPPGANFVSKSDFRKMLNGMAQTADTTSAGTDVDDGSVMTKEQLRETAQRHNLDFDTLLRDAESKGITIRD